MTNYGPSEFDGTWEEYRRKLERAKKRQDVVDAVAQATRQSQQTQRQAVIDSLTVDELRTAITAKLKNLKARLAIATDQADAIRADIKALEAMNR